MREDFSSIYAVTDDKYKEKDFNEKVKKENQIKTRGIEVGHIFYFSDKYSKPLNCLVDTQDGKKITIKMGSYGIGISRLVGAIIEAKYDEKNEVMKWPISVAPYDIAVIPMINKNDNSALDKANKISDELEKNNIETIIDDTDENLSSKIKKINFNEIIFKSKQIKTHLIKDSVDKEFIKMSCEIANLNFKDKEKYRIVFTNLHGTAITLIPKLLKKDGF